MGHAPTPLPPSALRLYVPGHALVIHPALPELMQAVLALKNRNGLIHIHECPFLATEVTLGRFAFEAIDKSVNFVRPFKCILGMHRVRV